MIPLGSQYSREESCPHLWQIWISLSLRDMWSFYSPWQFPIEMISERSFSVLNPRMCQEETNILIHLASWLRPNIINISGSVKKSQWLCRALAESHRRARRQPSACGPSNPAKMYCTASCPPQGARLAMWWTTSEKRPWHTTNITLCTLWLNIAMENVPFTHEFPKFPIKPFTRDFPWLCEIARW